MANVNSIIEVEIKIFINRKQLLAKKPRLRSKAKKQHSVTPRRPLQNDKLKTNISNIMRRILERKQKRLTKYSMKPTVSKKKRINRKKCNELNKKSKGILKYIRQEIKYHRRHRIVSLYRQQKRSSLEYRQKKILDRRRNQLKAQYTWKVKTKFNANQHERKSRYPYKHMITYGV